MNFYEANRTRVLAKCFASLDTLFQHRSRQNRSKYNTNGTTQQDHKAEALGQRHKDFYDMRGNNVNQAQTTP